MTLFQVITVWSLRCLVGVAAIEFAFNAYEQASQDFAALTRLREHPALLEHLQERTAFHEAQAREAQRVMAASNAIAWRIPAGDDQDGLLDLAGDLLRDSLLRAGAQALRVEVASEASSRDFTLVTWSSSWRESDTSSPSPLAAATTLAPAIRVATLRMDRAQGTGMVDVQAVFMAPIKAAPPLTSSDTAFPEERVP